MVVDKAIDAANRLVAMLARLGPRRAGWAVALAVILLLALGLAFTRRGDRITVRDINAPSQIGGRNNTQHNVLVNQPAVFQRRVVLERTMVDGVHHLLVHFIPTVGMWQPGETFAFEMKLKEPCLRWRIPPTFGSSLIGVTQSPKENTDQIFFKIQVAPKPGADVVFDIEGSRPPELVSWHVEPMEPLSVE